MFDFEQLDLYQELKKLYFVVFKKVRAMTDLDSYIVEQWKRASLNSVLNLAEGTGRMTPEDKKHFYTIARGNVFECAALLEVIFALGALSKEDYEALYDGYEKASKMLLGMYRSQ